MYFSRIPRLVGNMYLQSANTDLNTNTWSLLNFMVPDFAYINIMIVFMKHDLINQIQLCSINRTKIFHLND